MDQSPHDPPARPGATGRIITRQRLTVVAAAAVVLAILGAGVGWRLGDRSPGQQSGSGSQPGGNPTVTGSGQPSSGPPSSGQPSSGQLGGNEACGGFTDEFDESDLDPTWQRQHPGVGEFKAESGAAEITAKEGADLYPSFVAAPLLVRVPTGSFTVETRVAFDPQWSYQGAGLVFYESSREYVRLERGYGKHGAIIFEYAMAGRHVKVAGPFGTPGQRSIPTEADVVELRLVRSGRTVTASWREPDGDWQEIGAASLSAGRTYAVGPAVMNRAQAPHPDPSKGPAKARFDYVRVTCLTGS